ncbi:hypothetical protein J5N97_000461 [Dioscorea zingiberensis]|uniref:F-box domain-containing protein n=1 Tax=Dioscorea zingiberensis TaxID=325984 RepID=A0A9D5H1F7_9LILI|nr:hypothetical protein J5N97_000461 [Dioscorea zingiberensis]
MAQTKERRIRCDSSSAAETVADVEELLTKILVSVPPRSLVRFKCVSKHWLTLISDPGFFRRQTHQKSKISGFFSSKTEDEFFKSIALRDREIPSGNPFKTINDSFADGSKLRILQSCNGLFLCHIPIVDVLEEGKHHPLYVVNPTTNQFRALSCPSSEAWDPFMFREERLGLVSATPPVPLVVKNIPLDFGSCPTEWPRLAQRYFGESGGHLYLIETYQHSLPDSNNAFCCLLPLSPRGKDNEVEDSSTDDVLLLMPGKVIYYNLRNNTFKTSVEFANKKLF